jgi:hypothetical protein
MSGQKTVLAPQLGNLLAQQNNWIDQTAHLIQLARSGSSLASQASQLLYCKTSGSIQRPGSGYILDSASYRLDKTLDTASWIRLHIDTTS